MKTLNKILEFIIYIMCGAILVRLGVFSSFINWLMKRTSSGATYLQAIIEIIVLIGVIALFIHIVKDGLDNEKALGCNREHKPQGL